MEPIEDICPLLTVGNKGLQTPCLEERCTGYNNLGV
jgi:hypothetical protein